MCLLKLIEQEHLCFYIINFFPFDWIDCFTHTIASILYFHFIIYCFNHFSFRFSLSLFNWIKWTVQKWLLAQNETTRIQKKNTHTNRLTKTVIMAVIGECKKKMLCSKLKCKCNDLNKEKRNFLILLGNLLFCIFSLSFCSFFFSLRSFLYV